MLSNILSRKRDNYNNSLNNPDVVLIVKLSYLKNLDAIKRSGNLLLCVRKENDPYVYKYELIIRSRKIFSFCRSSQYDIIISRYECLSSLIAGLPNGSFRSMMYQHVLNIMVEHPTWLDVHIAAYCNFANFFVPGNFSPSRINSSIPPDCLTPLHIAIRRNWLQTIRAILRLKPNIYLLDSEGNTIVHYIALFSKPEIIHLILSLPSSFKMFVRNDQGLTPVQLACTQMKQINLRAMIQFGLTVQMLTVLSVEKQSLPFMNQTSNNRIVQFTSEQLDQIDFNSIQDGGCPLHWTLSSELIEKLLDDGFFIDTPNFRDETPLFVMIKENRLKCALSFLFNEANVNQPNCEQETPLFAAVKQGNKYMTMALLVFDADINYRDHHGRCARHIASICDFQEILSFLCSMKAKKCELRLPDCKLGCIDNHLNFNKLKYDNIQSFSFHQPLFNNTKTKNSSRMICIDGGGVKGLFTIQVLIELGKYLQHELHCYFDWISGTSAGAIIALLLASGKSLQEIRKSFFNFKDKIIAGKRPYKTIHLEDCFRSDNFVGELLLSQIFEVYGKHLLISACRVDQSPLTLNWFRSYLYPGTETKFDPMVHIEGWKALRASTAAPTFFHPFPPWIDGGLVANNPTLDSLVEFYRYRKIIQRKNLLNSTSIPIPELSLVVSFGNGHVSWKDVNHDHIFNRLQLILDFKEAIFNNIHFTITKLKSQLTHIITHCNNYVPYRSEIWCRTLGINYFRINPIQSKLLSLNETSDYELIRGLFETKQYTIFKKDELRQLALIMEKLYKK